MAPSSSTSRLVFLDVARFLAIGLMTFAHVVDSLVLPSEWGSGFGQAYALTRGATAPLFLLVSGWAFALSSRRELDAYRTATRKLLARGSRVLTLFLWGWVLTLPWWHPGFPYAAPEETWVAFSALSALHCVGLSLFLAHGVLWLSRSEQQLERGLLAVGLALVVLAPWAFTAAGAWPWWWQGVFRATAYPAGFPLFPWGAFFFVGAAAGLWSARRGWTVGRLAALLGGGAVVSLAVAAATEAACTEWLGDAFGFVGPSLVLRRLGVALGVLAVAAWATRRVGALPTAVLLPSRRSLTFYVAHMAVIWGTPWFIGLHHAVGPWLTFGGCAAVTFVLLAVEWVAVRVARAGDEGATALAKVAWTRWRRRPIVLAVAESDAGEPAPVEVTPVVSSPGT